MEKTGLVAGTVVGMFESCADELVSCSSGMVCVCEGWPGVADKAGLAYG